MDGKLLRLLDRLFGSFLYLIFILIDAFYKPTYKGDKILAIKLWALGESILTLPAIKSLKSPGNKISVLVTRQNRPVFAGLDFVDEIITLSMNPLSWFKIIYQMRKERFGICIDFEPYTKFSAILSYISGAGTRMGFSNRPKLYSISIDANENFHAVKNFMNLATSLKILPYPSKLVRLRFAKENKTNVDKILKKYGVKHSDIVVGIHAGSATSSLSRRWPEHKFAELCDSLIEKYNCKIILVGGKTESEINSKIFYMTKNNRSLINLAEKLKLKDLFALMEHLTLFIANDSGPMHVAAAMGTQTIGLFGPNLPERYGPYGKGNIGIYKGNGIPAVRPFRGIFSENNEINNIEVEDVMKAVGRLLKDFHQGRDR